MWNCAPRIAFPNLINIPVRYSHTCINICRPHNICYTWDKKIDIKVGLSSVMFSRDNTFFLHKHSFLFLLSQYFYCTKARMSLLTVRLTICHDASKRI